MTRALMGLLAVMTLGSSALGQTGIDDDTIEQPFAEGGAVRLSLSSGDYTLRAGDDDRIVVRWCVDDEARVGDLRKMSVDLDVSGTTARVVTEGPTKRVRFTIEIPAHSDVYLRGRAGDVRVDGIEGHKDIRLLAGDLTIGIRPATLSRAHASVTFGDIEARPLGMPKGGITRSLKWTGAGPYTLDARLFAGDLVLSHQR